MGGLDIREAVIDDTRGIARIDAEREGGNADETEPLVRRELELIAQGVVRKYTCVGVSRDAVVAYGPCALLSGIPGLPEGWFLSGVVVEEAFRRCGIGVGMTRHRLDWLRDRTDVVYDFVAEEKVAPIALHAKFGFSEVARGLRIQLPGPGQGAPPVDLRGAQALVRKAFA